MSDVLEAIRERRSIRRYQSREVPDESLNTVLEAIRQAPSWANTQCWEVVVVRDPAVKRDLQAAVGRNPAFDAMVDAPVVLVFCAQLARAGYKKGEASTRFGDWYMYDLGIATQNALLAAYALGLGTVVVGRFDHDEVERILGVPDGYEVVSMVPMGYPAAPSKAPPRRPCDEFVHVDRFRPRKG